MRFPDVYSHKQRPILAYGPRTDPFEGFDAVEIDALLAEPDPEARDEWMASTYSRVMAATTGPVAIQGAGGDPAAFDRLREAGWLVLAPDAGSIPAKAARASAWPAHDRLTKLRFGVGSPAPKLIVVGDRDPKGSGYPFYSETAGHWLFAALRVLGWDELTVYLCNAKDPTDRRVRSGELMALYDCVDRYDPIWLAAGKGASSALGNLDIQHVHAWNPAYARRFHAAKGPEGYAAHLRQRGLPPGPWEDRSLYRHDVASAPTNVPPILHMQRLSEYRPDHRHYRMPAWADECKRLYITGEVDSIKEAAERLGRSPGPLYNWSRVPNERGEDWAAERERYRREEREQVYQAAQRETAKQVGDCVALAWNATKTGLRSIARRWAAAEQADDKRARGIPLQDLEQAAIDNLPTAFEVSKVGKLASALGDQDRRQFDAESRAMAELPWPVLVKRFIAKVDEQFGVEVALPEGTDHG